jgi:hypothetical protein
VLLAPRRRVGKPQQVSYTWSQQDTYGRGFDSDRASPQLIDVDSRPRNTDRERSGADGPVGAPVVREARSSHANASGLRAEVEEAIIDIVTVCIVDEHVDAPGQAVRRAQERSSDGSNDQRKLAKRCGCTQSVRTDPPAIVEQNTKPTLDGQLELIADERHQLGIDGHASTMPNVATPTVT